MSSNFSNMWIGGATGISSFTFSMPTKESAEELIKTLLQKKVIAEVTQQDNSSLKLTQANGELNTQNEIVITGVTSDLRIAELVESVSRVQKKDDKSKADIVILPVNTGSNEYIKMIKEKTENTPEN